MNDPSLPYIESDVAASARKDVDVGQPATGSTVRRLVGVYDASGTIGGELSYFVRARIGLAHCALCAITHGRVRERSDWRACRDQLPVAFVTYHRDDQPDEVEQAAAREAPVVLAETSDGLVRLLGPVELARCNGSPSALYNALIAAAQRHGLGFATRP
jgi:hypothetical protein